MSISVLPKRNIVIPSPDGKESVRLHKDVISQVPDWAPKSPYYRALVADKKLLVMTPEKKGKGGKRAEEDAARKAAEEEAARKDKQDAQLGDASGGSDNGGSSIENPESQ